MIIRMLMFPIILLMVLYFVIAHVVPMSKSISAVRAVIVQEEENLENAKQRLNQAKDFQQSIIAHPEEMSFISDFVPNDQREETILSDIAQLAEESGISLFSVGFAEGRRDVRSTESTNNRPYLIEGKMIASGEYENFKEFSSKLFRMKRLYAFKTFDLTKNERKNITEETTDIEQDKMLSGVISFVYDYIPSADTVDVASILSPIDFDLIDTIMQASTQTNPLVSEPKNRPNPFLP